MIITAVIDAHRRGGVEVCDIPGAYLSADMDEEVIVIL